jgi:putative MFS transporter
MNLRSRVPVADVPCDARIPYDEAPTTKFHALVSAAAAGGQFSDGYVLGTIGIALSLARGSLHLNALWLGLLGGASLAGLFVGSLFVGPLADRFGRKPFLVPTMALFSIVSILQFFVRTEWQLLVLRLLLGLALGVDYVVCCTVVAEFSPVRSRGRLLSLLVVVWSLGYTAAFIVGTLLSTRTEDSWRLILLSSAIPSFIVLILRTQIPETPTWLVQNGRPGAARQIVTRHLGPAVQLPVVPAASAKSLMASWKELFSDRYRRRTIVGATFYMAQVIPYFAISTFIPAVFEALGIQSGYLSGAVFNVFMLFGTAVGLWLIDKITRRQFLIGTFYFSAVILSVLAFTHTGPQLTVGAAALFAFVLSAATNLEFAYLPELFPARLRASGVGIGTAASRVGAALSTFMLPITMESMGVRFTLGLCVLFLVLGGVVCQALAPETQGLSIETS